MNTHTSIDNVRYESFGGIVSCASPPMLAWVDKETMRNLGYTHSPLWDLKSGKTSCLSAPTEVHFSVTNLCSMGCNGCYMNSQVHHTREEMSTATVKTLLNTLADMGVFHVTLGGGGSF